MKKWIKIEEAINNFLEKIAISLGQKSKNLTPKKIKNSFSSSKEIVNNRKALLGQKLIDARQKAIEHGISAKSKLDSAKVKAAQAAQKVKETDPRKVNWKKSLLALLAFILPPFIKLKKWYLNLSSGQIAGVVTIATVSTIASLNIYIQSNKIAEDQAKNAELVEQVENATAISRRPAYFKGQEKQFRIENVILPAYVQGQQEFRKLVIEFTLESSNRYILAYLTHRDNRHLIHDTLNSQIEPISISFPLEREGKIIVKEKIKKEINALLKKLEIKGEINEVHIHSMIAG